MGEVRKGGDEEEFFDGWNEGGGVDNIGCVGRSRFDDSFPGSRDFFCTRESNSSTTLACTINLDSA